mgnify:CR=1 FL=1
MVSILLPLLELTNKQARKIALISQGLHKQYAFGQGINGVNTAIQHLSYIQIDSISVVQRAHHHCLWSRVRNYQTTFLEQLISQQQVFEYWSHAAAYLPIHDYRFSLPKKEAIASGEKHWREKNPTAEKRVLQRIQQEGPLRAKDFEHNRTKKGDGWWDWKPDKIALEQLFIEGKLMIVERRGFQKVYDLTERVLPDGLNTSMPSDSEFEKYLITRYLNAHGFANAQQISYLRKGLKSRINETCLKMLENQELQQVFINKQLYLAMSNVTDLLTQSINGNHLAILSPFDNVLIQRQRLREIFDYDYQIECYVPAAKRQYGYFSLPLLWGTQFVGRMDAKIDRKSQQLHIQNLHLETTELERFVQIFKPKLQSFLEFNQGTTIKLHKLSGTFEHSKLTLNEVNKNLRM